MKNLYLRRLRCALWLILICIGQTVWAQGLQPGSLHTQEDLDRIKAKIQAQEEPYYSDYQAMISTGYAQTDFWFREQEYICRGGNCNSIYLEELDTYMHQNYMILARACAAAQALALRWHITGDDQYAAAAVAGLNKWANTMMYLRGNTNKSLAAGIYGYQMAVAGDLLQGYEGWPQSEQQVFKDWLIDKFYYGGGGVRDFLDRRHGTCDSHYRSNWDACNLAATMAIGVYCGRQDIFDYGVDYLQNGRGSGALKNLVWYIHPDGLGQTEETNRDQPHNIVSLGWTSIALEIARNQGTDLWNYDNHRFLRAVEYVAKYNTWESVPNVGYRTCSQNYTEGAGGNGPSTYGRGQKRPVWELIHNHFAKRLGIATPYAQQIAENNRPERGSGYYGTTSGGFDTFGYGTLLFYRDQEVPSAAPQGILTSQHGQSIVVSWLGSQGASGYEVKRASQPGGPYAVIGSTNAKTLAFTDDEVSIAGGTKYYYQITAKNTTQGDLSSEEVAFKPDLVSLFEFEDNANDTQGNNIVTLYGSPVFDVGKTGQAIVFDGEDDYLQLPERSYGYSDMTIATWVNWDGGASWQRIFDFGFNTTVNMMLTPNTGGDKMRFQISTTRGNEGTERIEVDALPVGEWVHVAVTLNGEIGILYVNGEPVGTLNGMKTKPRFPLTNSYIGKSQWPDALYKGKIDDFRIYNYPLNGADVWELAHPGEDSAPRFVANPMMLQAAIQDLLYSSVVLPDSVVTSTPDPVLTFSKIGGADWLEVAEDGTLSGSPENDDVGENQFVIQVRDTRGASDETTVDILVENVNDPPVWVADTLKKAVVAPGKLYQQSLAGDANDIDVEDTIAFSKVSGPEWLSVSPQGELGGTPGTEHVGENLFVLRGTDQEGAYRDVTALIKVLGAGLVAHYPFEADTRDAEENFHGTAVGTTTYDTAVEEQGIVLSGSDHVLLPEDITAIMESFTVTSWVKPEVLESWTRVFDFGEGKSNYMFLTTRSATSDNGLRYEINDGSTVQRIDADVVLEKDIWVHLAVSYDKDSQTGILYLNGQEVAQNTNMTLAPTSLGNTTQNYIGKSQWPDPNLTGAIDDFRIYNYSLDPSEIEALFQSADLEPQINSDTAYFTNVQDTVHYQITAVYDPVSFGAEGLPAGLQVDPESGVVSGTPTEDGVFSVQLSATNSIGTGNRNMTMHIFRHTLPGIVEMSQYNRGGEGVAYHDKSAGNSGGEYREDDVDIRYSSTAGGYVTGWNESDEWRKYTIEVEESKSYQLSALVASGGNGGAFHIKINGEIALSNITVPGTGGGDNWIEIPFEMDLEAGIHELTFYIEQGDFDIARISASAPEITASAHPNFYNIHDQVDYTIDAMGVPTYFEAEGLPLGLVLDSNTGHISGSPEETGEFEVLLRAGNENGTDSTTVQMNIIEHIVPGVVRLENYNGGGQNMAYFDSSGDNTGGHYRPNERVDIGSDATKDYYIGWINTGEWIKYTLDVQQSGTYMVSAAITSGGNGGVFHLEVDGKDGTGGINVPGTGGWHNWQEIEFAIALEAGVRELLFYVDQSGFSISSLEFMSSNLQVNYENGNNGQGTSQQQPYLEIVNEDALMVDYEELEIRYWFTPENYSGINTWVDYANIGKDNVLMEYVMLEEPHEGAFGYISYRFDPLAGALAMGSSGAIRSRFANSDWAALDQGNDYSFLDANTFQANPNITLYRNGVLVWGEEPMPVSSELDMEVYSHNTNGAPSGDTIKFNLRLDQKGNSPLSYEDIKVRYWFTREGAGELIATVDHADLGNNHISGQFVEMELPEEKADHYYEISFSSALGEWYPLSSTGDIQLRFHQSDWAIFDQSNDHSYLKAAQHELTSHITVYYQDELVYGIEPGTDVENAASSTESEAKTSEESETVIFYPNPVRNRLYFKGSTLEEHGAQLTIYNMNGTTVIRKEIHQNEGEIDVAGLPRGIYVVQIFDGLYMTEKKIIKK